MKEKKGKKVMKQKRTEQKRERFFGADFFLMSI